MFVFNVQNKLTISRTALLQSAHSGALVVGVVASIVVALAVDWLLFDSCRTVSVQRKTSVAR